MNIQEVKDLHKERNMIYKGEYLQTLSKEDFNNGIIKFNIQDENELDSLNGEGVWGWATPEDKKLYNDNNYNGEMIAVLCNSPLNFMGILFWGTEVVLSCHGENRPTISHKWLSKTILNKDWFKEYLAPFLQKEI